MFSHTLPLAGLFVPFFASLASSSSTQCFYPSGISQPKDTPCNPNADVSNCCAPDDICLSNGLCYRANINRLHRGSCTDPTFPSPSCAQICIGPNDHPFGWADVLEYPLSDQWYCGWGNQSRCERDETFKLQDGHFADFRYGSGEGAVTGNVSIEIGGSGAERGGQCTGATQTVTVTAAVAQGTGGGVVTASPGPEAETASGNGTTTGVKPTPIVQASHPASGGSSNRVEGFGVVYAVALSGIVVTLLT